MHTTHLCYVVYSLLLLGYKPVQHITVLNTVKVKVNFNLEQATKAQRRSRVITVLFL